MTEWQPIETAPRNGRWILVTGFKTRNRGPVSHTCAVAGWFVRNAQKPENGYEWFYGTQGDEFLSNPTHWMELPTIPAEIRKPPKTRPEIEVVAYSRRSRKPSRHILGKSSDENPVTEESLK